MDARFLGLCRSTDGWLAGHHQPINHFSPCKFRTLDGAAQGAPYPALRAQTGPAAGKIRRCGAHRHHNGSDGLVTPAVGVRKSQVWQRQRGLGHVQQAARHAMEAAQLDLAEANEAGSEDEDVE